MAEGDGPGVEKDGFDIEDDEEHCNQIELDGKALVGGADGSDAAFIGRLLEAGGLFGAQQERADDHPQRDDGGDDQHNQDGEIAGKHWGLLRCETSHNLPVILPEIPIFTTENTEITEK